MTWTPEQLAAHKALWLAALRSGEYKQTRGTLKDSTGFCCLGVACDVAIKSGEVPEIGHWLKSATGFVLIDQTINERVAGESQFSGLPPDPVRRWLGLFSGTGRSRMGGDGLDTLNDKRKLSFAEIADVIEAEPDRFWEGL